MIKYNEKCVTLYRRAYAVPSKKDARMGGTLHNVKSVIDALSVGFLKPRKFQLCVKDNVRSECYGYAIMASRGVHEGILYPQGTLFRRNLQHTGVGSHSTSQLARVFSRPQWQTSRGGSLRFCVIVGIVFKQNCLIGFLRHLKFIIL